MTNTAPRTAALLAVLTAAALGAACATSGTEDEGAVPPTADASATSVAPATDASTSDSDVGGSDTGSEDVSVGTPFPTDASAFDGPSSVADAAPDADASVDALPPAVACVPTNGVASFVNGNVQIDYDLGAGRATFFYAGVAKVEGFYAGIQLASYATNLAYTTRTCITQGNTAVVTNTASGMPTMVQTFVLAGGNHFLATLTVEGAGLSTNWISPVVMDTAGGVDVGSYGDPRVLWVPFDNDAWVSYNAGTMTSGNAGTSFEVAAFYDNDTRNGIVAGSVTHDTWKSGVYYASGSGKLNAMNVFGGATDPTWTHDVVPHGMVTGSVVTSPTMFVGYAPDWRDLMEEYANANAAQKPKLAWDGGVPFGWNSWGKIQTQISYDAAVTVSDYVANNLQNAGFSDDGTAYINLDSYWDNLSPTQLTDFVAHCHANGQKAGVYWTPFVDWGESATRIVEGTTATPYSDIWLHDGSGNPIAVDGAYAVDPTHPATKSRIDYFIGAFQSYGFDYIKLDFLSHGSLESTVRYDPTVQTGIQAYNQGMQYVLSRIGTSMFVSESIAPLFPYQYGHARRVSCDISGAGTTTEAAQGSSEYELNSATYGWWMSGRLYTFNDPDMMVFEGYTADDNLMRLLSATISGTVFLNGDDLTGSAGQALARAYLTNPRINGVAQRGQAFRPVEGNTGTAPSATFVLAGDGGSAYLAVFNYAASATSIAVDLTRAGFNGSTTYTATDLWSGAASSATGTLTVPLDAGSGKLFLLQ